MRTIVTPVHILKQVLCRLISYCKLLVAPLSDTLYFGSCLGLFPFVPTFLPSFHISYYSFAIILVSVSSYFFTLAVPTQGWVFFLSCLVALNALNNNTIIYPTIYSVRVRFTFVVVLGYCVILLWNTIFCFTLRKCY